MARWCSLSILILFAVYLDGLIVELSNSGVGCYWGSSFVGALAYADDIVLLAPCASALRYNYVEHLQLIHI